MSDEEYNISDDDMQDIDKELRPRARPRREKRTENKNDCPDVCGLFECIISNNCQNNCKNLNLANAEICELCKQKDTCTSKQKILLLGTEYLDTYKENKVQDILKGATELKMEHRMLEREYRTLTDEIASTSPMYFVRRKEITNKRAKKKFEILITRKDLEMLNVKYKVDLDFGNK